MIFLWNNNNIIIILVNNNRIKTATAKLLLLIMLYYTKLYRWIVVNIANETQFNLRYEKEWFDVGRFWDAPCNTVGFGCSSFSGSSTYWGAAGYHGVSGAALFYLQMPGSLEDQPITIAFSNPSLGSIKTRAEFSEDMKEVWKRMDRQCTHNDEKDLGTHNTKFQLTSTPGTQAKVTITQINTAT